MGSGHTEKMNECVWLLSRIRNSQAFDIVSAAGAGGGGRASAACAVRWREGQLMHLLFLPAEAG